MADLKEITVPDIGDFTDVPVIEVLVNPGDTVAPEDPLVTLESDKATMDVPAPFGGVVQELRISVGDRVSEGSLLLVLAVGENGSGPAEAAPATEAPAPTASKAEPASPEAVESATDAEAEAAPPRTASSPGVTLPEPGALPREQPPAPSGDGAQYASPAVRKLARALGVDLAQVQGTGRKGRITPQDLTAPRPAAAPAAGDSGLLAGLPPWPTPDFEKWGAVERQPQTRIQKLSGPNIARSWVVIPHVTHNDEADITELEAFRKETNASQKDVKVTMVALLIKASVASLKAFPVLNSSLEGDEIVLKQYWNIGFAADTPQGLMVPVVKNADQKGVLEIAAELMKLSGAAREGKLKLPDMQGATFTISSLGGLGGTSFTPIVNAPEVAILGVTRSAMKPVWDGSEFKPRLMVPLSLSYDHRVIDGALAARFTSHLAGVLGDFRRVLL